MSPEKHVNHSIMLARHVRILMLHTMGAMELLLLDSESEMTGSMIQIIQIMLFAKHVLIIA